MNLLFIALAPILLIAFYIYWRDKHEKEPVKQLMSALVAGIVIVIPIFPIEMLLKDMISFNNKYTNAMYYAFVVAAFSEEIFKYIAFFAVIWRNKNFNELFDGIVYAAYISLGFAAIENILYVFQNGFSVGIVRAFTAVPAHALFGITMGYYFSLAKFEQKKRGLHIFLALVVPIFLHGFYDFCLMSKNTWLLLVLLVFFVVAWILGFKKMKKLSKASVFINRED